MATKQMPDFLPKPTSQPTVVKNRMVRLAFFVLGCGCVVLGVVGVYVPLLPTTPFMILAAGCFAKSSHKFYLWLMTHKVFGKLLIDWQQRRAIPRYAKYLSFGMMSLSCGVLFWRLPLSYWWVVTIVCVVCLAVAIWMARLPDA